MNKKNERRIILSQEEMSKIENFDRNLLSNKECFYLDLFLVSFYTGGVSLRNLANLKWENINEGELNCKDFEYPLVNSIIIDERVLYIIDKYKTESTGNHVFPIFTFKHNTLTQKEGHIKRLAQNVNMTLHKIFDLSSLKGSYPTMVTAKYSFIAQLYKQKIPLRDIYNFAGTKAFIVESYLHEHETPEEKKIVWKDCEKFWIEL